MTVLPEHRQATLQGNKNKQQNADGDLRPPGAERAVEVDIGLYQPLDSHAEQRSQHRPHPAAEQRAANDHRSNRIQLNAHACKGITRLGIHREDDPRQRRQAGREHIDADGGTAGGDPHQVCRRGVTADGVNLVAKPGTVGEEDANHHHAQHQQPHRAQAAAAGNFPRQAGERVVHRMVNRNRLFRDQIAHPAQEEHSREGNDKRRDF